MDLLRILQVYDYMQLGGAETHIITLSKALMGKGHNVQIVSSNGPAVEKINELGIDFHELDVYDPTKYFINAEKIIEIIEREKINIVHVHPFHSQVVMSLVKLIKDIPIVTTIHGAYRTPSVEGLNEFFDRFIFVSEEANKFHLENKLIRKDIIEIIPNCVPLVPNGKGSILNTNILKVVYVSRIDVDKLPSILFFIKCIEEIVKYLDVEITFIGQGSKYNELINLVNDINQKLNKSVVSVVNGSVDVVRYMKAADIVVGVGRVLLEALSINKIPLCIGNNHYVGILNREKLMRISEVNFTDRNSTQELLPELLIKDLLRVKQNPGKVLMELKETILQFKKCFDIKISAERHENLYRKVINEYSGKKFEICDISKYKLKLDEIEKIHYANELKANGYTYILDGAKEIRILLMPNFYDKNDWWSRSLIDSITNNKCIRKSTVVIRIDNQFHSELKEIIEKIQTEINPYENEYNLDILIDCEYQDYITETLFLSEIDYFVPTNKNQHEIIYKCKLLEVQILNNEDVNVVAF
ncbi:glycosyltransferase [Oceanobacillus caeni]|uniref:glycosyltransferase n=1 Tax=Oceanobacillus caeni TaxID=405946 RepID=UPI0036298E78